VNSPRSSRPGEYYAEFVPTTFAPASVGDWEIVIEASSQRLRKDLAKCAKPGGGEETHHTL